MLFSYSTKLFSAYLITPQVVLTKLSKSIDKDSVRVDGVGPASITEVSFQEISVTGKLLPIH